MLFIVIKDIKKSDGFKEEIILSKNTKIEVNNEGYFIDKINKHFYIEDFIKNDEYFKKIDEIEFSIDEIDEIEDNKIKRYRMQLDIKTSLKKLKIIESEVKKLVSDILYSD